MLLHHATLHLHGVLVDVFSSNGVKNGSLLSRAHTATHPEMPASQGCGGSPFINHPIEDTDTAPEELEREFGGEVRNAVEEVTDEK